MGEFFEVWRRLIAGAGSSEVSANRDGWGRRSDGIFGCKEARKAEEARGDLFGSQGTS